MEYEDPDELFRRLALGREEFCQRLLTMLILGGRYPRWNSRSQPCAAGVHFLRSLDGLSFGASDIVAPVVFVDELELPARHELERGGAPDYAVLSDDRLWIIELKTERLSHRVDQLPSYFRLGAHHHPGARLDITYLTPAMKKPAPELDPGQRYAHLTWSDVTPLIDDAWGDVDDPRIVRVREGLLTVLGTLEQPASTWRALATAPPSANSWEELGRLTARDGKQRGVELNFQGLEQLQQLRIEVRDQFAADAQLSVVRPWIWNAGTSGGQALTAMGAEHGYELRLSASTARF